jgi:sec-independent protein translocase protein TatC
MPDGQGLFEGFWGHITEFIKRMKIVLAVFVVALFVMLILPGSSDFFATTDNYKPLMSVLLVSIAGMFLPADVQLFAGSMSDPITLYAYAAVVFAVGFALPVFAYEAYKFIVLVLFPHERKSIFPFVFAVSALFVGGGLFGFFFLAPSFIQGFMPFYDALNAVKLFPIMDFYGIVFLTIIVSGIIFTIPAFFVVLVKFGVLHTKTVSKNRKYVYAGLAITAMVISPGATPLGNLYLFLALFFLVEISVFVGKRFENKLGQGESQSLLSKWISPTKACRFCNSQLQENAQYCPTCKRYLK